VNTTIIERRRRRRHSAEFKGEAVAACRQPGVSIAAVAMSRSVNANLLRRWVVEAERATARPSAQAKALPGPPIEAQRFVPVALEKPAASDTRIRIEVRRGATTVIVEWPPSAARECAEWLSGLVR
jgi:transposase